MKEREKIEVCEHSHEITKDELKNKVFGMSEDVDDPELDPIMKNFIAEETEMDGSLEVRELDKDGFSKQDFVLDSKTSFVAIKESKDCVQEIQEEKRMVHLPMAELIRYRSNINNQIKSLKNSVSVLEELEKKLTNLIGEENLDLSAHFKNIMLESISKQSEKVVEYINNDINNNRLHDPIRIED